MRIKLTIEIELEEGFDVSDTLERAWMETQILTGDGSLLLHSNDIGDTVVVVKSVKNIEYTSPNKGG